MQGSKRRVVLGVVMAMTVGQSGCGGDAARPARRSVAVVSTGDSSSCALLEDGTVWCWGFNGSGELGDGTKVDSERPVQVAGIRDATALEVGQDHSCVVVDGGVRCWGWNSDGQLGDGTLTDSARPVAVPGLEGVRSLAADLTSTCALTDSGSVVCWGDNEFGQLGDGSANDSRSPVEVVGISNAEQIDVGYRFACAIVAGGKVSCWGDNHCGQLGHDPATTPRSDTPIDVEIADATQLSAGYGHACAVVRNGAVRCWGSDERGQLGDTMLRNSSIPVAAPITEGAVDVAAGFSNTCAIANGGRITCWGVSDGVGTGAAGDLGPHEVRDLTGATHLSVSVDQMCASADGAVRCWGPRLHMTGPTTWDGWTAWTIAGLR